ncbi:MAG TPA: hypothetical protein VE955_06090 [Candidatus Dormibacteraeota bacterium]|nr:hypothetical protein [Candidatus Dormibacteraeota bacterium]
MSQTRRLDVEGEIVPTHATRHARVILDLTGARLVDRPSFLEEKLLKTHGIIAAEINVFSNRMTVEFDPSLISIDKIRTMVRASGG